MARQRLINCDFFTISEFFSNLSNKAKLLYFCYLVNADDKGFVGNAKTLVNTLDQCEEDFSNVLFQYKYADAMQELVDKHLVLEFSDKLGNKTYLIKHWFLHNKNQQFLTTNFISYLAKVDLIDNEYQFKNNQREKPLKEKEIKENKLNQNKLNIIEINNKESDDWEEKWDKTLKELGSKD